MYKHIIDSLQRHMLERCLSHGSGVRKFEHSVVRTFIYAVKPHYSKPLLMYRVL